MLPCWVNLMAFVMKLFITWNTRFRSVLIIHCGKSSSVLNVTLESIILNWVVWTISSMRLFISTSEYVNSNVPASILERSRMSLINCSSRLLLFFIILIYSCLSASFSVMARISEKPTIELSGVRISWLMFARNADFKRLLSSACSLACSSFCSICLRSVITTLDPMMVFGFPA